MKNRDHKKKRNTNDYPACCIQILTKQRKKLANFIVLEVLRHLKAQKSQLSHIKCTQF